MISGWFYLAIGAFVAVVNVVMGNRIVRAARRQAAEGYATSPERAVWITRIGAAAIFLIFAAMAFGLIPVAAVRPIQLH